MRGLPAKALLDSGNTFSSCISDRFLRRMGLTTDDLEPLALATVGSAKEGAALAVMGQLKRPLQLRVGGYSCTFPLKAVVLEGLAMDINLSGPWMKQHGIDQIHSQDAIMVRGTKINLLSPEVPAARRREPHRVMTIEKVVIPPGQQRAVRLRVPAFEEGRVEPAAGLLTGNLRLEEAHDIHTVRNVLLTPDPKDKTLVAGLLNTTPEPITIEGGSHYGFFEPDYDQSNCRVASLQAELARARQESEAPEWAKGPTTSKNYEKRASYLLDTFRLKENPVLANEEDRGAILAVLLRHFGVFALEGEYGKTDLVEHRIRLKPGTKPVKITQRPVNPALEPDLRKQVLKWLATDVIEPSSSPWSSPLVPVKKKSGEVRWCIDFRRLNACTIGDAFSTGDVDCNLARLAGSTVFSTVDASGAFHQIGVEKSSREATAFSTPWGLYQFKRMPFGITGGPSTYARLVTRVLEGVSASMALAYLDDILIHSRGVSEHVKALDVVLRAHAKAGLLLQPAKCHFAQKEVVYLGHLVSAQGIKPVPEYVDLVKKWPLPRTRSDLRAFLGKTGYYRRFVPNYAARALPLQARLAQDGTKDSATFDPDPEYVKAFEDLRKALTEAPVLAHPIFNDPKAPFILDTDWSGSREAVGGVLSQVQGGQERVVAYGGLKLTGAQRRYSAYKGELYALLAFLRKWSYFLKYAPFIIRTDHCSLKYLPEGEPPDQFVQRWLEAMASFDFTIQYRKGERHGNADSLSRAPHIQEPGEDLQDDSTDILASLGARPAVRGPLPGHMAATAPPMQSEEQATQEQARDAQLQAVLGTTGAPVDPKNPWVGIPVHKVNGVAYTTNARKQQVLLVPSHLQLTTIKAVHWLTGHKGREATLERLQRSAFFPRMREKVQEMVSGCGPCQTKTRPVPQKKELHPTRALGPFRMWSIDFVGPLPPARGGYKYLLTCKCPFTKWVEIFPTRDMTAATVVRHLIRDIYPRFGLPERLHSDCGPAFTSQEFRDVGKVLGVKTTFTPPYHPQSNPVERAHQDIVKSLTALTGTKPGTWPDYIPMITYAMRCTPCRVTGVAPFEAAFGRLPPADLELFFPLPAAEPAASDLHQHARDIRDRILKTNELMETKLQQYLSKAAQRYRGTLRPFVVGDKVHLFTPKPVTGSQKFKSVFWSGPYRVAKVINNVTYAIVGTDNKSHVVPIDRLRPYGPHFTFEDINWDAMPELNPRLTPKPYSGTERKDDSDDEDGGGAPQQRPPGTPTTTTGTPTFGTPQGTPRGTATASPASTLMSSTESEDLLANAVWPASAPWPVPGIDEEAWNRSWNNPDYVEDDDDDSREDMETTGVGDSTFLAGPTTIRDELREQQIARGLPTSPVLAGHRGFAEEVQAQFARMSYRGQTGFAPTRSSTERERSGAPRGLTPTEREQQRMEEDRLRQAARTALQNEQRDARARSREASRANTPMPPEPPPELPPRGAGLDAAPPPAPPRAGAGGK